MMSCYKDNVPRVLGVPFVSLSVACIGLLLFLVFIEMQ